ncbi:esterase [Mycobacterium sp. 852013-50091_SCH5140682]|uniref:CocE/NonD family hydrolase n=1 Tax=Mycobacterium sp. 852013-50091_SCH5140682 TaxID=1834109 RepID=UPI0007E983BC|nr:CocE/NonD family hydrolase [Mycobacterium sp. 852013-50091_SCH5140682]OBC05814.1 esterase [Mycobacterium sp. 852013-50091_SCH5140682]
MRKVSFVRAALAVTLTAVVFAAASVACVAPTTEGGSLREWGYLSLPDGNRMRYSVLLPSGPGPHPVLVEYDGYSAGSDPDIGRRWTARGYAVVGVNVPGTGCSTGDDRIFDDTVGAAGAAAVEWAASQPWSTGRVGMIGYSYSGYSQLWTAAQRPKGLVAITPSKNVADPYRDVGYPGGIQNVGFPAGWWNEFPTIWKRAAEMAAALDGDDECAAIAELNIAKTRRADIDLEQWLNTDHFFGQRYADKSAYLRVPAIDVPAFGTQSWQDEQVGTRAGYYEELINPDKMWLASSNGDHHTDITSADIDSMLQRFLAHFVKGDDNGFDSEPHVRLLQEMQAVRPGDPESPIEPASIASFDRLPVKVTPMRLWLREGGVLSGAKPHELTDAPAEYRYPADGPTVNDPDAEGWQPSTSDGQLTFTTAALPADLSFYGAGSADIWFSSTAADTDLQVTVSEVRPDGTEMFVQRGWLRASLRGLDGSRTTELRPWGDFTEPSVQPLRAGRPTPLRIEIHKFAHVFRAGSSIRITVDAPSKTGYWVFDRLNTPATNTVWTNARWPSSVVLGYVPYPHASALSDCARTSRQPCRANQHSVPPGIGPRPPM